MVNGWTAASGTATGARHLHRGEANEDACAHRTTEWATIVAVADGHGSPRCPRAHIGAELAVRVAIETLTSTPPFEMVATHLVDGWLRAVSTHAAAEHDPTITVGAYGTTLLAAVVTEREVHLFRCGDGTLVTAGADRATVHRPSVDLLFGETTGLASPGADALVDAHRLDSAEVDLVLLATDGFGDAFVDPDWHQPVVVDIRTRLSTGRVEDLSTTVSDWCRAPAAVAGDDASLALAVRDLPAR